MATEDKPKIPLPKDWTGNVRSAVLHVIGLAQFATAYNVISIPHVGGLHHRYSRAA